MLYHLFAFCRPITALAAMQPDASAVTANCSLCDSGSHDDMADQRIWSLETVVAWRNLSECVQDSNFSNATLTSHKPQTPTPHYASELCCTAALCDEATSLSKDQSTNIHRHPATHHSSA